MSVAAGVAFTSPSSIQRQRQNNQPSPSISDPEFPAVSTHKQNHTDPLASEREINEDRVRATFEANEVDDVPAPHMNTAVDADIAVDNDDEDGILHGRDQERVQQESSHSPCKSPPNDYFERSLTDDIPDYDFPDAYTSLPENEAFLPLPDNSNSLDDGTGSSSDDDEFLGDFNDDLKDQRTGGSNYSSISPTYEETARSILHNLRRKFKAGTFIGLITLYGKPRLTLEGYRHVASLLKPYQHIPGATTLRQNVFPFLVKHRFVSSERIKCPLKQNKPTPPPSLGRYNSSNKTDAVRVLPSQWARFDVRCFHTLRGLVCLSQCKCFPRNGDDDVRIESVPRVSDSHYSTSDGHIQSLWVSSDGQPVRAMCGSRIRIHTFNDQVLPSSFIHHPQFNFRSTVFRGESSRYIDGSVLCTFGVHYTATHGARLRSEQPLSMHERSITSFVDDCCIHLQKLCEASRDSENDDTSRPDPNSSGARGAAQWHRGKRRRTSKPTDSCATCSAFRIGDLITLLSVDTVSRSTHMVVYVSRFWPNRVDDDRQLLLFLYRDIHTDSIVSTSIPGFGVPTLLSSPKITDPLNDSTRPTSPRCFTRGILDNGSQFIVIRLLLYADDFNPRSQLFPRGSVGGVYMGLASSHIKTRRSQTTIRVISLTPPGVTTNFILDSIINDLVNGCLNGFDAVDAFGDHVTCFFEVVGFVGDYPASSAVLDVTGHTSLAPCTHCGFQFCSADGVSKFCYTASITSCHSSFRRTQARTKSMRAFGFNKLEGKQFGLQLGDISYNGTPSNAPLLKFCDEFNHQFPGENAPSHINSCRLDGYSLNIIAPDHLLTGLMKGILLTTFRLLPSADAQTEVQILLSHSLADFGFPSHAVFYKNRKLVPGLSMSAIYAIFSIFPAILTTLEYLDNLPTKSMIVHMHRFMCLAFWWPRAETDGLLAWELVHGSGKRDYVSMLHTMSTNFVKSVRKFSEQQPDLASFVDRPNAHRMLELTCHTLRLYSHLLFVSELVFESTHQPLKFNLSRNSTSNSHIYAVELILAKDWLLRIHALWSMFKSTTGSERDCCMNGLMTLFCGKDVDAVKWNTPKMAAAKRDISDHIVSILSGSAEERLQDWYGNTVSLDIVHPKWKITTRLNIDTLPDRERHFLLECAHTLSETIALRLSDLTHAQTAIYFRGYGSSSSSSHERLDRGDIVQVLLDRHDAHSRFIITSDNKTGSLCFFLVGGFLETRASAHTDVAKTFLIVRQCTTSPSHQQQIPNYNKCLVPKASVPPFYNTDDNAFSFIQLTSRVRKVGVIHDCGSTKTCTFNNTTMSVTHSTRTLDGGDFYLFPRNTAYPPRRS